MRKENTQDDQMATDPCAPEEAAKKSSHYEMQHILKTPFTLKTNRREISLSTKKIIENNFQKRLFPNLIKENRHHFGQSTSEVLF